MWDNFKFSVKKVMEAGPPSLDDVAKVIANSYDATMKLPPAGDFLAKNTIENGNVAILENAIRSILLQQSNSPEQLPIINAISNAFVSYWSGATLTKQFTPLIPAPGSTGNILTKQCFVSNPGLQVTYPFNLDGVDNVDAFLDKLIMAANAHLSTVAGIYVTDSLYPPNGTVAPGVISWAGFSVNSNPIELGLAYEDLFNTNPEYLNSLKNKFTGLIDPAELAAKGQLLADAAKAAAEAELAAAPPGSDSSVSPIIAGSVKDRLDALEKALIESGITSRTVIIAVKSTVMKESGGNYINENINYSTTDNDRIYAIFGSRVAKYTPDQLTTLKQNVSAFADVIYGKNSGMGLGNNQPGDAMKYRGRGLIQLTGRSGYEAASLAGYGDKRFLNQPELVNTPDGSGKAAAWLMNMRIPRMIKKDGRKYNGINDPNMTQADANLYVVSSVAGERLLSRSSSGFVVKEGLAKVDVYSKKFLAEEQAALAAKSNPTIPGTTFGSGLSFGS